MAGITFETVILYAVNYFRYATTSHTRTNNLTPFWRTIDLSIAKWSFTIYFLLKIINYLQNVFNNIQREKNKLIQKFITDSDINYIVFVKLYSEFIVLRYSVFLFPNNFLLLSDNRLLYKIVCLKSEIPIRYDMGKFCRNRFAFKLNIT